MEVYFLGGASQVGCLGMLWRHDRAEMLFDYGFLPTNPPKYPMQSPPVDLALLSHAHIDHSGMIPWLCGRHDSDVIATPPTIDVADLLLEDSLKVSDAEGYPPPFDKNDLKAARKNFKIAEFGESFDVGGVEVTLHSAGHIPGATMFEINSGKITLFTGDFHTLSTELVWGAHPVKCDNLIIESTYAGRSHPDRLKIEYEFLKKVQEVVNRGGIAIVPCFAVGRTQEILLTFLKKKFDVWLDGMGKTVNGIYLDYPEYIRSIKKLKQAMKATKVVHSVRGSEKALKGETIVTTSGMLDGGPVLGYLERLKEDPKSAILLTGYQVEGTNGRKLMDEGRIDLFGVSVQVKCEVSFFDFSAHAGHDDLVRFIDGCDPEKVVLCHGDNREALAKVLVGRECLLPLEGKWYPL